MEIFTYTNLDRYKVKAVLSNRRFVGDDVYTGTTLKPSFAS